MLERSDKHWSAPKMDRLVLRIVPNAEAVIGMLRSGELNFLSDYGGDPEVLEELAKDNAGDQGHGRDRHRHGVPRLQPPPAAVQRPDLPQRALRGDRPQRAGAGGVERLRGAVDLARLAGAAVLARERREGAADRRQRREARCCRRPATRSSAASCTIPPA